MKYCPRMLCPFIFFPRSERGITDPVIVCLYPFNSKLRLIFFVIQYRQDEIPVFMHGQADQKKDLTMSDDKV